MLYRAALKAKAGWPNQSFSHPPQNKCLSGGTKVVHHCDYLLFSTKKYINFPD